MHSLNPMNHPDVVFLRAWLSVRVHHARTAPDLSRGASAIEWAIITGLLAAIALVVGGIILKKTQDAANKIETK
jgi:type IV secretory pathway TrbD component